MLTEGPPIWDQMPRVTSVGTTNPSQRGARTCTRISSESPRFTSRDDALGGYTDGRALPILENETVALAVLPSQLRAVTLNVYSVSRVKLTGTNIMLDCCCVGLSRYSCMCCTNAGGEGGSDEASCHW